MIGILLVAQLTIVAHAADTVGACQPLDLSVAISAPVGAPPQLTVPPFGGFDVMRAATMPTTRIDSRGAPSNLIEYRYTLVSSEPGRFVIPPFEARVGSVIVHSRPLSIVVTRAGGNASPSVITRARIDTGQRLNLRAEAPDTVYVGQQANYTVAVFLNAEVRNRLRHNPTFYPPDMQSMLAYDLPANSGDQRPPGTSSCFDVLAYRRALFPLQAGRLVIPPAQLTYSLPVGTSFFSREESHELQTDSAVVIAIQPPVAGQPADFDGAVGRFQVAASLETSVGRVGDPLTLTVTVSGSGNVKLIPAPHLDIPWAVAVPSDERVTIDSTASRIGGSKAFDWVLTPHVAGELDVPPVRYSYFNPSTRRYEVSRSTPVHVRLLPGTLAAADTADAVAPLPVRRGYRGPVHAPLSSYPLFWLAFVLAPLPALRARWRDRKRLRHRRVLTPVAQMAAATQQSAGEGGGRAVRRTFVGVLGDRLGSPAETFSTPGALRRALRRAGVSADTADAAEKLLRELDTAAFALGGHLAAQAATEATAIIDRIDHEALPRRELPFRTVLLGVLLAAGLAGTGQAQQRVGAGDLFANGVLAYQKHNYAGARDAFARVAAAQPRAADAWVNFGTAAWAMHDTVNAVVGWRHALGLQPLTSDARSRLELVHGLRASSPGYVPPVPLNVGLVLMALCWLAACLAWHPRVRRRMPWTAHWPVPLVVGAAVFGLLSVAAQQRLSARGMAVVRASTSLQDDPAFGAGQGPVVVIGEMVRVLTQVGAWDRVQLDGGRQGWLPVQGLVLLDAAAPPALN